MLCLLHTSPLVPTGLAPTGFAKYRMTVRDRPAFLVGERDATMGALGSVKYIIRHLLHRHLRALLLQRRFPMDP